MDKVKSELPAVEEEIKELRVAELSQNVEHENSLSLERVQGVQAEIDRQSAHGVSGGNKSEMSLSLANYDENLPAHLVEDLPARLVKNLPARVVKHLPAHLVKNEESFCEADRIQESDHLEKVQSTDKNNTTPQTTPPPTTTNTTTTPPPTTTTHRTSCAGENGLHSWDNSGPSTACKGGNGPGPPQGTNDHNPPYQVTQPPPTNHNHLKAKDKNVIIKYNLNIYNSKTIKKKWREIKLTSDKKFEYIEVVDFGVATTTNDKKKLRKRQEKLRLKSAEMLKSADNREILRDMCAKKRQDFFNKLGGMRQKNEVDKNMKRKRDAEVQQEDNQYKKNTKVEENLGDNTKKSDASGSNSNSNWGQEILKRNTVRSEMHEVRASQPQVQGGKVQNLMNIFQNCENKIDCEASKSMGKTRGQSSCLAVATNKMQYTNHCTSHLIGGDFRAKADGTNEKGC